MIDKLADELGIDPLVQTINQNSSPPVLPVVAPPVAPPGQPVSSVSNNDDDFEFARENLRELVKQGMLSIDDLKGIAIQSSSVYAYEIITSLIKTLTETNTSLLTLREKKKKIEETSSSMPSHMMPIQANNVFVGGTYQLQQVLKEKGLLTITDVDFPPDEPQEADIVPESEKSKQPVTAITEEPVTE